MYGIVGCWLFFFPSICYHCLSLPTSYPHCLLLCLPSPPPLPINLLKKQKNHKKKQQKNKQKNNNIIYFVYTRPSTYTHLCYYLFSSCIPLHVCHTYTCTSTPFPCYLYSLVSYMYLYSTCCNPSYVFCLTTLSPLVHKLLNSFFSFHPIPTKDRNYLLMSILFHLFSLINFASTAYRSSGLCHVHPWPLP